MQSPKCTDICIHCHGPNGLPFDRSEIIKSYDTWASHPYPYRYSANPKRRKIRLAWMPKTPRELKNAI